MTYIPRFAIHNFIINFLFNSVFANAFTSQIFIGINYIEHDEYYFLYCIVETVVKLFFTTILYMLSIKWSVHHASKGEMVPNYEQMKKFLIIYFGVIAIVQCVMGVGTIAKSFPRDYIRDGVGVGFFILKGVCLLGMIPYTLKVYKADIARDKISVERIDTQEKVSKIVYKRKRNLIIAVITLVLFIGYLINANSMRSWENFLHSQLNSQYDFDEGYTIKDVQVEGEYKIFKVVTTDQHQIEFEAKVFWGNMNTPMGPTIFIERIYVDNFQECVESYLVGDEAYDITNKSVEDVLAYINERKVLAKTLKKYYDMLFEPDLDFKLKYNGKVFEFENYYSNKQLEETIREILTSE